MQITTAKHLGGLYEEVPKIAQLRRNECEKACDVLGIPYDNATDGAYILQRRLQAVPEADVLRAAGREDLLDDAEQAEDMRARIDQMQAQLTQMTAMNERLMAALEGRTLEPADAPPKYADWTIQALRAEVKHRGLSQTTKDDAELLREKLRVNDTGQSSELSHPDGDPA